ncbi:EamA family transporter [Zhenhengia yiwuensis]|uniref:EamA family transporter n=1 Tax=Zhenhengia yiwuensis TaxID=2763666 RepID=UPI002A75A7A2|nr:EamA family transporter [Zhenhengia yiwuensis]MDY3369218.1 EamA family transporter [Zhenhengia yiwuensis]
MWMIYGLLSAVFAALTSILAKIGMDNVNSNLATAIRTMVVLVMAWIVVGMTKTAGGITQLTRTNWIFLILSGIATGASWLFYYKAIQIGEVSKVVPLDKLSIVFVFIFSVTVLKEPLSIKTLIGTGLITLGTLVLVL